MKKLLLVIVVGIIFSTQVVDALRCYACFGEGDTNKECWNDTAVATGLVDELECNTVPGKKAVCLMQRAVSQVDDKKLFITRFCHHVPVDHDNSCKRRQSAENEVVICQCDNELCNWSSTPIIENGKMVEQKKPEINSAVLSPDENVQASSSERVKSYNTLMAIMFSAILHF